MKSSENKNGKHLALVLGSGGLKCAAALGLWKVLAREGIDVDMLTGCSGGSIFASGMAMNWSYEKGIEKSRRFVEAVFGQGNLGKHHWPSLLRTIMPRLFKFDERFAIFDDRRLMENLELCFGDLTFADTHKPLRIVATDLHTSDMVVLSEGRLVHAIRASICIPFLWTPHKVGKRLLVDGAAAGPLPVDVAIKERYDIIMAMGFLDPPIARIGSTAEFAMQILNSGASNIFKAQFALHSLAHHSEIVHIIPEFDQPVPLTSLELIPSIIKAGERATEAQLPYLHRLLETAS